MGNKDGRLPDGTGLSQAEPEEVSALRASIPSAFKPASYEGKPRSLPKPDKQLLGSFFDPLVARLKAMPPQELFAFIGACRRVSPINCRWSDYAIAKLLHDIASHAASAIEARSDETRSGSAVGESAGPKGDAQSLVGEQP